MNKVEITVFFAGAFYEQDREILLSKFSNVKFEFATQESLITFKEYEEKFKEFIEGKNFNLAIVEYIELSNIIEYLPPTTITMLDTHDLVFEKIKSFKEFRVDYDGVSLSKKDELEIFECYDYVLLIQKKDFEKVAKEIDNSKLLLVTHPPFLEKISIREICRVVGYVASPYQPNIEGFKWFLDNIWPVISSRYYLTLHVYGNIGGSFVSVKNLKNITFHGFIDDLQYAYREMDIAINPVRCGAGLKIKNVEALGYGIPLITTSHGASGMEEVASKAFLVADTPIEFLEAFDKMIKNVAYRTQIGNAGFEYANTHFSKEISYGSLLNVINNVQVGFNSEFSYE